MARKNILKVSLTILMLLAISAISYIVFFNNSKLTNRDTTITDNESAFNTDDESVPSLSVATIDDILAGAQTDEEKYVLLLLNAENARDNGDSNATIAYYMEAEKLAPTEEEVSNLRNSIYQLAVELNNEAVMEDYKPPEVDRKVLENEQPLRIDEEE